MLEIRETTTRNKLGGVIAKSVVVIENGIIEEFPNHEVQGLVSVLNVHNRETKTTTVTFWRCSARIKYFTKYED